MQRAMGLIPGWGTKILHTTGVAKKTKPKKEVYLFKKKKERHQKVNKN